MTDDRGFPGCKRNPHATPQEQTGREGGWHPREEREKARVRGRALRLAAGGPGAVSLTHAAVRDSNPALAALAENVRDYAIFLMDPEGTILYWGTGAHLMKWWTAEEAEGGHLSMLYPEGGGEDGTAFEHLCQAAELGEYVGEGQRVRRDGSAFWAGITLTALRGHDGDMLGFAKVTRDLTAERAREAMLASVNVLQTSRDAAVALAQEEKVARVLAEEHAEFAYAHLRGAREYIAEVLEPELREEQERSDELRAQMAADSAARAPGGAAADPR